MRGIGGREGKQAGLTKTFGHVGTGTRAQTGFELDGVPAFRGGSNRFSECTKKTRREGTHLVQLSQIGLCESHSTPPSRRQQGGFTTGSVSN